MKDIGFIVFVLLACVAGYFILNYQVEVILGADASVWDTLYYSWIYGLS